MSKPFMCCNYITVARTVTVGLCTRKFADDVHSQLLRRPREAMFAASAVAATQLGGNFSGSGAII